MALENKLGITDSAELAREEERISKTRALELFEQGLLLKAGPVIFVQNCAVLPEWLEVRTSSWNSNSSVWIRNRGAGAQE